MTSSWGTLHDCCQTIAITVSPTERNRVIGELRQVIVAVADTLSPVQRVLLKNVIGRSVIPLLSPHHSATTGKELARFLGARIDSSDWHRAVLCFLEFCTTHSADTTQGGVAGSHTQCALEYIHSHFRNPHLRLADIADHVHVSTWYLERLIKRDTGSSALSHVHCLRLTAARDHLADSHYSVKEIAALVGYDSVRQLHRHFTHRFAISPSAFREAIADTESQHDKIRPHNSNN